MILSFFPMAAPAAAAGLIAKLRGDEVAREEAYAELLRREAEHSGAGGSTTPSPAGELEGQPESLADIAVAVTAPLCEILCKPLSEVRLGEYCRAWQVVTALSGVDPARVLVEGNKPGQTNLNSVWAAEGSALGLVLAKEPASFTIEDALTLCLGCGALMVQWSSSEGQNPALVGSGLSLAEYVGVMTDGGQFRLMTRSDEQMSPLCPLLMKLIKAPESLPDFAFGGVLGLLAVLPIGHPSIAAKMLELGGIDMYMDILRRVTPAELVTSAGFARRPHGTAMWAMKDLIAHGQNQADISSEILACGYIDTCVAALTAVEQVGAEHVNGCVVVCGAIWPLWLIDGVAMPQIEEKLRTIPISVLRYAKENRIVHFQDMGFTSGTVATILAACTYGKAEDNPFRWTQEDIDGFVALDSELVRGEAVGVHFDLLSSRCRGLLSLCISDAAKTMLLNCRGFIPHL